VLLALLLHRRRLCWQFLRFHYLIHLPLLHRRQTLLFLGFRYMFLHRRRLRKKLMFH